MRISDLSRQGGLSVATIKFYLREGLLPPGTPTARNQTRYDETHVRRLALIRAFTQIGGLELTLVRALLSAIDNQRLPLPDLYELVDRTLSPQERSANGDGDVALARSDVDAFLDERHWKVKPDAPGRDRLALVLSTLRRLGCECDIGFFTEYAEAAERMAVQELDLLRCDGEADDRAAAVVRTVLLEAAMSAIRRMAQEHHVVTRFGHTAGIEPA
ncbi:MerR family transcriptional regulator [Dactylosporangium sp. NPDC051484]|uniref:MerR family transcriptional regulator n=1 Tax=Dactylosporangium sp. NPDC051484 TaxID=3154942 RepID=UPI00344CF0CB